MQSSKQDRFKKEDLVKQVLKIRVYLMSMSYLIVEELVIIMLKAKCKQEKTTICYVRPSC